MVTFSAGEVFAMLAIVEATTVSSIVWASRNLVTESDLEKKIKRKLETHKRIHHSTRKPKDD